MSSCTLCSPDSLVETKALELLKKVYAHFEAKHNTYNNDAPGHAHYKKGLWDKDGERCGWCATWEEVRAHINAQPTGCEDNEHSVWRFVVKCPHCGDELLFSEDRGVHCDGCEDFHEYNDYYNVKDNGQSPVDPLVKLEETTNE
jgi:hypothetical protein